MRLAVLTAAICLLFRIPLAVAAEGPAALRPQASQALFRATSFFRQSVSTEGGYLWRYSHDLARREGENVVGATTVWIQPPGTPSVGEALLGAWRATGQRQYLNLARDAAVCLVRGQLQSGGWDYRIEFDPNERAR